MRGTRASYPTFLESNPPYEYYLSCMLSRERAGIQRKNSRLISRNRSVPA